MDEMDQKDPLALLRYFTINKLIVEVTEDSLIFRNEDTEHIFPKSAPTKFQAKTAKKFYDLFSVYTCLKYATLTFGEYVGKCRGEKAGMVSTVDKKELLSYLRGEIEASAQIFAIGEGSENEPQKKREKPKQDSSHPDENNSVKKAKVEKDDKEVDTSKEIDSSKAGKESDAEMQDVEPQILEEDKVLQRILGRELHSRDRTTVMNSHRKTFSQVLQLFSEIKRKEIEKMALSKDKKNLIGNARSAAPTLKEAVDRLKGMPIIVVPCGVADMITMINVEDFLQNDKYITVREKKLAGAKRQFNITIHHEHDDHQLKFQIVDTVKRFTPDDWKRVVAVIVSGQKWQFKDWSWNFPVEVFNKVLGACFYFHGDVLNEDIRNWNVKQYSIHKDKRHLDKVALKEFWDDLYSFMIKKFCY